MAVVASAQTVPEVTLTRLDCGPTLSLASTSTELQLNFSDTFAYSAPNVQLVFSCYLIKHDNDYMLWDTGTSTTAGALAAPKVSLVELLAQVALQPMCRYPTTYSHCLGRSNMSVLATITMITPAK